MNSYNTDIKFLATTIICSLSSLKLHMLALYLLTVAYGLCFCEANKSSKNTLQINNCSTLFPASNDFQVEFKYEETSLCSGWLYTKVHGSLKAFYHRYRG